MPNGAKWPSPWKVAPAQILCNKVKWQFYDSLDFLRDQVTPRRTLCNINEKVDVVIATQQEKRSRKGGYDPSSVLIQEATSALRSIAQKNPPPPPQ